MNQLEEFHKTWAFPSRHHEELPISSDLRLRSETQMPWYELRLPEFPHEKILGEVQLLKDKFVEHRDGERHRGWKSLCLHGISMTQTMCPEDYGLKDSPEIFNWTEAAQLCPTAKNYFSRIYPAESYKRIRFMLVEKGGYILPHKDRDTRSLGPLTIPLNVPKNCRLSMEAVGQLPFRLGYGYLMDISNFHSVWNQSDEDRYHIIVEANYDSRYLEFLGLILKSYEKRHPIGRWVNGKIRGIRGQLESRGAYV